MGLDIYFDDDVANRLLALAQANERTLTLVQNLGVSARDIALIRLVYQGALADVAVSFGLLATNLASGGQTKTPEIGTRVNKER